MAKTKVGIIGTGAIGCTHADAIVNTGAMEIAALCDPFEGALEKASKKYNCDNCFTDYRQLLKQADVDAVMVCTPNTTHREVAVAALRANKHTFCEKPMSISLTEAKKILAASKKSKGIFQMGMVLRSSPLGIAARRIIDAGRIGRVYHTRAMWIRRRGIPGLGGWFTTKALSGGGPMIDLGVHMFDLAMYLSDLWTPTAVSAKTYAEFGPRMKNYVYTDMWAGPPKLKGTFDVEDYSAGFVRFGKQASMNFEIVWAANHRETQYLEILGDKGGMRLFDGEDHITVLTEADGGLAECKYEFAESKHQGDFGWMFGKQAERFAAACQGKTPPIATAEQGVTVMKLLDSIYKSSENNKEVVIR